MAALFSALLPFGGSSGGGGGSGAVDEVIAGTGISVNATTGSVIVTNNGVRSVTAGTGISIGGTANVPIITCTVTDTGITTLNTLTGTTQTLAVDTTGPIGWTSSGTAHTLNMPTASGAVRGVLASADWTTFNDKVTSLTGGTGISIGGTTTVPIVTCTITGITTFNTLTGATQTLAVDTTGPIGWTSSGTAHTLNMPDASASVRGVVTTGTQTFAGAKTFTQSVGTGTQVPTVSVTGPAHTALTASTESLDVDLSIARTVQWATGALTLQRFVRVSQPTIAFVGASTVTNAATFQIDGAPVNGTNATLTETASLRVLTGLAAAKGIVVRLAGSQTGNAFEIQNSAGTAVQYVLADGSQTGPAGSVSAVTYGVGGQVNTGMYRAITTNRLGFATGGSAALVLGGDAGSNMVIGTWSGVTPYTIRYADASAGTTNRTATSLVIKSGQGTGSGAAGYVAFETTATEGSGTTLQTYVEPGRFTTLGLQVKAGASTGTIAKVGGTIFQSFADVSSTSTDGSENDLFTYTTPAACLTTNGDAIKAEFGGIFVGHATATRKLKVYFAGTAILDTTALITAANANWVVTVFLIRVSATVVRYAVTISAPGMASVVPPSVGELTGLTLTGTNILKLTGAAADTGAASGDIVAKLGSVEWRQAA